MYHVEFLTAHKPELGPMLVRFLEATGRKASNYADSNPTLPSGLKFASYLSEIAGFKPEDFLPVLQHHIHMTAVVVIHTDDLNTLFNIIGPMKWVGASTKKRDLMFGLLSGSLNEWQSAIDTGLKSMPELFTMVSDKISAEGYLKKTNKRIK